MYRFEERFSFTFHFSVVFCSSLAHSFLQLLFHVRVHSNVYLPLQYTWLWLTCTKWKRHSRKCETHLWIMCEESVSRWVKLEMIKTFIGANRTTESKMNRNWRANATERNTVNSEQAMSKAMISSCTKHNLQICDSAIYFFLQCIQLVIDIVTNSYHK